MKRRILSIITALALCLSLCPTWALAAEADPSLCKHHPEHTEDCGYAAPTEGHDCGHEHTEDCYITDEAGGEVLDCQHSHDSECGYVQADPGAPCGYECRICPIEDLIAALPDTVTEDNAADVRAQLDRILDLYRELTEDEQGQLDLSRIYALQGALDGANAPDPMAESVTYQEAAWNGGVTYTTKTAESCTPVTDSTTAWNAGWYVVNSTVTISEPITVTGAVNLILADGCTLTAGKGIVVTTGNSLTIYAQTGGTGTLNATGTVDSDKNASAGIGGSAASVDSGTITIHGGEIKATGGVVNDNFGNPNYGGAGIGGGSPRSGNGGSSGAITIYGGTITANSGTGNLTGAGIGGGGGNNGGAGSNITIYGGNVIAESHGTSNGGSGAGIGGGFGSSGGGTGNNIQIHGGTVNATGGFYGAGIGGGGAGNGSTSGSGTITISGGNVTTVGGNYAAGIGGGGGYKFEYSGTVTSNVSGGIGSVTISGGIVDAKGGAGNSSGNYAGDPIGNGGNTTATATVEKTNAIVFENGAGTVCGDVTFDGSYTVPAAYTLNIPAGASLSGSGTLSGGSAFTTENLTEDMISVPTDLYYTREDRTEDITTRLSGELTTGVTICGQTFAVSGWTLAVAKTDDLHYTATYTNNNDNTNTFTQTITLQKSGTDLSEGKVKTYNGETATDSFTAGDTITVKATPTPTGEAPVKAVSRLRGGGKMAVFVGDTQVSAEVDATEDGSYTMTVPAADVLLAANGPKTGITLTARFTANDNMADGEGTVKVNITAVAVAERDGNVIDYFGVSDFEGTNNLFFKSAYANATITLLGDVQPSTNSNASTTCSTMVNITCSLDLAGHNFTSTDIAIYVLPGGNLTIQDSSTGKTGTVSSIKNDGTLKLYGGTFGKIETAYTLASLLAENCAYYRGSTPIPLSELEGQKTLDGTVTVQECRHKDVTPTANNDGTHTLRCPYCGYTKAAENCDYGEYTHNDTSHTRICKLCGYQNVEAHEIKCTAEASGTVIAVSEACKTCGYGKDLGTVTIHIPKLVYGDLTGVVTAENTLTEPVAVAGNVKNPLGETIIFSDHATIGPPTMATLTGNALLSAGEHKIKINIVIIRDENALAECELPFTVAKAPLTPSITGTATKPYDGTTNVTDGQLFITLEGVVTGNDVTATASYAYDNANAGENKTITASDITLGGADAGNYQLSSPTATTTGTITKSQPTIAFADGYNSSKTYDGQTISNPTADDLTITGAAFGNVDFTWYAGNVDEANKLTNPPRDAGTYTLTASIPVTDNTEAAEAVLTVTISPKTVTPTITITPDSYKYTGSAIHPSGSAVKVMDGDTVIPDSEYTLSYGENTQVGTGSVTVTDKENGNYKIAQATGTFAITKANQAPLTITGAPGSVTYGDTFQLGVSGGSGTGALSWATSGATVDNAGNVTITRAGTVVITAVKEGDSNYVGTEGRIMLDVSKKALTVTGATAQDRQYDGTSAVTITGVTLEGIVNGDTVSVSTADLTGTLNGSNAGSYTAVTLPALTLTGEKADNYTLTRPAGAVSTSVTISKADAPTAKGGAMTVSNDLERTYSYSLDQLLPVLTGGQTFGTVTYSLGTVSLLGDYYTANAAVTGDKLSLPINEVVTNDEKVIGTVEITISSTNFKDMKATITISSVEKIVPEGTPTASPNTITYGQSISAVTLSGQMSDGTGRVDGRFTWDNPNATPDAGTYQAAWTFIPTDTGRYTTATGTVTITVRKATPSLSLTPSPATLPNGGTVTLTLSGLPDRGSATVTCSDANITVTKGSGNTWTADLPAGGASYTFTASYSGDGNHNGATANCTVSVEKITPTLSLTANPTSLHGGGTVTLTLSGLPAGGTATVTCSGGITVTAGAGNTWTATLPNNTATYTFTASYAGNASYNAASASCTVEAIEVTVLPNPPAAEDGKQYQVVMEDGISEVPAGLQSIETLNTPEKLETAMKTAITQANSGVPQDNTAVYDVELQISDNGGATWTKATAANFPANGLTVTLPYPAGTNSSYTFTVVHMFTTSDFNKTPGDTETPRVTNTASGLQFTVTGLSPISVGWVQPSTPTTPTGPTGGGGGGGGGSSSAYAVTVERAEHGKVTSNRTNASSGSTVTLTVTPDTGYVLDTLTVTDSRGNEIRLTAQGGGKYTFTMPSRAVTVKAAFAPLPDDTEKPCDGGVDCPSHGFTDLGTVGTWYHEAVDYVLRNDLMGGYGNGLFGPNDTLTRAQFAQILYNKEGRPAVTGGGIFTDVAPVAWCAPAITWAAERGIVGGYGNGMFGPNDNITREQLAVMLWRYAGSPAATEKELHFTDADKASGYALEALRWAVENGVMSGKGGGILDPKGLATRAQTAQMLKNFLKDD